MHRVEGGIVPDMALRFSGWARLVTAAVALGVYGFPTLARSSTAPVSNRVALLPVDFRGDLPDTRKADLVAEIRNGLGSRGLVVLGPDRVRSEGGVSSCEDDACVKKVAKALEVQYVVRSTIAFEDKNYELTLEVFDANATSKGRSVESCELCGAAEANELLAEQALRLQQKLALVPQEPAHVRFQGSPDGAVIIVDGVSMGRAPLKLDLDPGTHRVEVAQSGYLSQVTEVTTVAGLTEQIDFTLEVDKTAAVGNTELRASRMRLAGGTLLGVAAVFGITAATFIAIDGQQYTADCDDRDMGGDCPQRYNTLSHGIAFAVLGGASLVSGAVLLGLGRQGGRKTRWQTDLGWRVDPTHVSIRWGGRF